MPSDVLVHPVETLVQAKVHRLILVASLDAVSVARTWEGATDDLFEHSLPEIGTCCATEKSGKVAPQAWHNLLGCSLGESIRRSLSYNSNSGLHLEESGTTGSDVDPCFALRLQEEKIRGQAELLQAFHFLHLGKLHGNRLKLLSRN